MGTKIFTFGPLEPEKMKFKDGNPSFKQTEYDRTQYIFNYCYAVLFQPLIIFILFNCYLLAELLDAQIMR